MPLLIRLARYLHSKQDQIFSMEANEEMQSTSRSQEHKNDIPTHKLHVCNIPKKATRVDLKRVLSSFGEVECNFLNKDSPGVFAFVKFALVEDATKAVVASKKKEIMLRGRYLVLHYYESKRNNKKYKKEKELKKKSAKKFKNKLAKELNQKTDEEEITGDAFIDMLDDDCLLKIFMYLPVDKRLQLEDVCTRWRDLSEQAWHDIKTLTFPSSLHIDNFFAYASTQKPYFEHLIERCGRYLTSLNLNTYCSSFLTIIRKHCINLQKLQVEFSICNPRHFDNAFNKLKKLEQFEIKNIRPECSSDCLSSLPATIQKIHMSMRPSDNIFDFSYKYMPRNTPTIFMKFTALKSLTLNGYIIKRNVAQILSQKQTIEYLNLSHCEFRGKGAILLTNLVNLENLNLERVFEVDNEFLTNLSIKCQNLKQLNVSHCIKLTDKGIIELAKMENLEILLVNHMTDSVTDEPFGRMLILKTLECEYSIGIGDPGIMRLLKVASKLNRLCLAGTAVTNETVLHASNITKARQNNIKLHLRADRAVIDDYDRIENLSPLLTVEGKIEKLYDDVDDGYLDDTDELYDEDDDDDDFDFYYDWDLHFESRPNYEGYFENDY